MSKQPSEHTLPLSADDIDKLIHEPARLLIMAYLAVVESADLLFLRSQTGLTWGNLSSHVSKLEQAGYVVVDKSFVNKKPRTMLTLTEEGRSAFERYRKQMGAVFNTLGEAGHAGG